MTHTKRSAASRTGLVVVALAAVLAGAGCKAKLNGSITVNGAPFTPQTCQSGVPMGFSGVELADGAGQRLRLITDPAGSGTLILVHLPAGAPVGVPVPGCGTVTVTPQNSRVNNVQNVEGRAQIQCITPTGAVQGSIEFGNCH